MEKIAVYGTLKTWWFWHKLLKDERVKYNKNDFVSFELLENEKGEQSTYPKVSFSKNTSTYLQVEIYNTDISFIEEVLDVLEWYIPKNSWNMYERIMINTLSWEKVWVYHSVYIKADSKDSYFIWEKEWKKYFNWN